MLFFSEFGNVGNATTVRLRVMRSQDKGASWSSPITVAQAQSRGVRVPETNTPIRDGANLGSIAVGPDGLLVIAWQDARFSIGARDGIAFSRSADGGLTWSLPVQINAIASVQAMLPTATIRDDGLIGVTYYDFRNHAAGAPTFAADAWLATSLDGLNWSEIHVAGPFDLTTAPYSEGLFLGDYQGLVSSGDTFIAFYAATNGVSPGNGNDVFSALRAVSVVIPSSADARAAKAMAAKSAPALAMTPALEQVLTESARLTLKRRFTERGSTPNDHR